MPVPESILNLVDRFELHLEAYRSGKYNETQVRRDFLDPFWKALGWDIHNEQGFAEAYRDVIHEDAITIGGMTKAPDYCFRVGGTRKFFLEAKKPSVSIKDEIPPAFQLRRYAWSAKLPLSVLSDFEEFAVYDTRVRPDKDDPASNARVFYCAFREYAEKWDWIASVFSRDAVLKGSFDKFAESAKAKRGTATVDNVFLDEIESWRKALAQNLALRNPGLSQRELNFAVQRIIDRIIFLRICEDRGIEDYGRLQALQNGNRVYPRLCELFQRADDRYNSGLFHFSPEKGRHESPDELTLGLDVDDKLLRDILRSLYYPESPYEFSVLSADILGQVYERFLGKTIRLTAGHRAVIEDKPEVKKAGGVYYTPTYVVDYIVRNTVGKLLEGKRPAQAARLKLLDPACGSGSFLIGAYQYLLDWHLTWYVANNPARWARGSHPPLYQTSGGWRLTVAERKRILLNSVFGVDIDSQAVEVTKLSLLLKVLEGETGQTLQLLLRFSKERALPDLGDNIKCGNSLIGPDFYDGQQMSLLDAEDRLRVNVFDYQTEFPEVMKSGGFDAVIGNPPYVRMEAFKELKTYLKQEYACHDERSDLYAYFIERSHHLMRQGGQFGMIVSNKFLRANYGKPLRDFLCQEETVSRITDFAGLPVFVGATVRTLILLTKHEKGQKIPIRYSPPPSSDVFQTLAGGSVTVAEATDGAAFEVLPSALQKSVWNFAEHHVDELLSRLQAGFVPLMKYCDSPICRGVVSGYTEAFVLDGKTRDAILKGNRKAGEIIKPFINGRNIRRYFIDDPKLSLIYTFHGIQMGDYPAVMEHLRPFKQQLLNRATKQEWYELQQPQFNFSKWMGSPKIIFPDMAITSRFALDEVGYYGSNTTYFIPRRDLYLLGLLNSKLGSFYFVRTCAGLEGKTETYLRFFGQYLEGFPVRVINFNAKADKTRHDLMVSLVEQMLDLCRKQATAKTPSEQTALARQVAATDGQIDRLVYELYGLTEEEIGIVEGVA